MHGFLFRGRWLVGHVVVAAVAALFVTLGFWQLDRNAEVRTRNEFIRARLSEPPTPLQELLESPSAARYRRATARGMYITEEEVLIRYRSLGGRAGEYLLTPLVPPTSDGAVILVNRGWRPADMGDGAQPPAGPPVGWIDLVGILMPSERPAEASSPGVYPRIDLEAIDEHVSGLLADLYLQLESQVPDSRGFPVVLPPPALDAGPHLSYAIQWFLFTLVGLIGWPLLLRRAVREREATSRSVDSFETPDPPNREAP